MFATVPLLPPGTHGAVGYFKGTEPFSVFQASKGDAVITVSQIANLLIGGDKGLWIKHLLLFTDLHHPTFPSLSHLLLPHARKLLLAFDKLAPFCIYFAISNSCSVTFPGTGRGLWGRSPSCLIKIVMHLETGHVNPHAWDQSPLKEESRRHRG